MRAPEFTHKRTCKETSGKWQLQDWISHLFSFYLLICCHKQKKKKKENSYVYVQANTMFLSYGGRTDWVIMYASQKSNSFLLQPWEDQEQPTVTGSLPKDCALHPLWPSLAHDASVHSENNHLSRDLRDFSWERHESQLKIRVQN